MKTYEFEISRTNSYKDYETFVDRFSLNGLSEKALDDFKFNPVVRCYKLRNSIECPKCEFARVLVDLEGDAFFDDMTLDHFYIESVLNSFKKSDLFPHLYVPDKFDRFVTLGHLEEKVIPFKTNKPVSFVKNLRQRSPLHVLKYF